MSQAPRHRNWKTVARAAALGLGRPLRRLPRVKRLARALLDRFPALQTQVHRLLHRTDTLQPRRPHVPQDVNDLSPATQALYQELKHHFETRKR